MSRKPKAIVNLLGPVLVVERARGTTWKELEIRYGLCRTRLYMLFSGARKTESGQGVIPKKCS